MHAGIHNNNNKYYGKQRRQREKRKGKKKKLRILWISTEICLPCVRRLRQNTRNTGLCVTVKIYKRFSGIVFTQKKFEHFSKRNKCNGQKWFRWVSDEEKGHRRCPNLTMQFVRMQFSFVQNEMTPHPQSDAEITNSLCPWLWSDSLGPSPIRTTWMAHTAQSS